MFALQINASLVYNASTNSVQTPLLFTNPSTRNMSLPQENEIHLSDANMSFAKFTLDRVTLLVF